VTIPAEGGSEGALCVDAMVGRCVVDSPNERSERAVSHADDDREGSLRRRGEKRSGRKDRPDLGGPSQARNARHGEDGGVDSSGSHTIQARVHVASHFDDREVGSPAKELGASPQAARPDPRPGGEVGRTPGGTYNETVPRVRAGRASSDREPGVEVDRKVLRAVNREVDLPSEKRSVDSVRKIRRAPRREVLVSARLHRNGFEPQFRHNPGEPVQHEVGLDAREGTASRSDTEPLNHG
jgi:hypothetical protein